MKIIKIIFLFSILFTTAAAIAQDAESSFHRAAGDYVKGNIQEARNTVASALKSYPNDPKLNELMGKLNKEKPENKEEQQNKQEEENKEQNNEEQNQDQNKEEKQQNKEGQQKEEEKDAAEKDQSAENKEEENKESGQENKDGEQGEKEEQRSRSEKLEEINLTEEKARMILEAMRNSEIQYIQQNKRKIKENSNYGKPDW